jgi:SAM-dependent MidA family methyltransferase
MLLIDYGAAADALYGPEHPRGTLRCYWRHTMNEDPLSRVGCQDITAHVDFSAVTRAALGQGLTLVGATGQAELLGRLGLPLLADAVESRVTGRSEQRAHRRALHQLIDLKGLGGLLALAFGKRALETPLMGFARSTPAQPPSVPEIWQLRI